MNPEFRKDVFAHPRHHLSLIDLFSLSLRVFKARPSRTLLTVFGISLGVGFVLFLVSLGYGLQYLLLGRLVTTQESLVTLDAYYPQDSNKTIGQADINRITALSGVGSVSPVAQFSGEVRLVIASSTASTTELSGFSFVRIIDKNYFRLSGISPTTGFDFGNTTTSIILSSKVVSLLGISSDGEAIGKSVNLLIAYPFAQEQVLPVADGRSLIVRGVIKDDAQPPFVLIDSSQAPALPPFYSETLVKAADINEVPQLKTALTNMGFLVSSRIDLVNQVNKIMTAITIVLVIFGIAALVIASIGMFNTMLISFMERIFEVGIMKALGATAGDIRNLFLAESLIMGLLGGVGGILLGIFLGDVTNIGLNLLAQRLGGQSINLFVRPIWFMVVIVVGSGVIGILSGFLPARRATHVSPKEAFIRK